MPLYAKIYLTESGFKLKKGAKAVKLIYHEDFDGIFSAILTFNQLKKQGVNPDNITTYPIQYGVRDDEAKRMLGKKGQMSVLVDFSKWPEGVDKPDIWSDHHVNEPVSEATTEEKRRRKELAGTLRDRSKHSQGGAAIGQTKYRSESEHLSVVHAKGLADPTSIKAMSDIDSATYENLEDALNLTTDFRKKGRMGRLANITNVLISSVIKNNPNAVDKIIRESQPSIVSIYNKVLEVSKITEQQREALEELEKESPDWKKIDQLRVSLPKKMAGDIAVGKKLNTIGTTEKSRETNIEDIEKHTNPKTTKFKASGVVIIQDAAGRGQPSRYLGSLLTKQDGTRYPATMREWPIMLQVALNPDLAKEYKDKVDLVDILKKSMQEVKNEMGRAWSDWSFNIIFNESGGHKSIATLNSLGTIGFLPRMDKEKLAELEGLDRRLKDLKYKKTNLKSVAPAKYEAMQALIEKKKKMAEQRVVIKKAIKEKILAKVNEALSDVSVQPTANPERFKVKKPTIKEEILFRKRNWTF